jgi:hypothetical protein
MTDRLGILLDRWPYAIIGGLLVATLLTLLFPLPRGWWPQL